MIRTHLGAEMEIPAVRIEISEEFRGVASRVHDSEGRRGIERSAR